MEYMEIPTIPKAVLDNLLVTMASPAPFKEPAPVRSNNGYRPLPVPLFNSVPLQSPPAGHPKGSSASLPPLPGGVHRRDSSVSFLPFPSPPESLLKDLPDPSSAGPLKISGPGPLPIAKDKPKRVRKSRAGTTPRKRANPDPLGANSDANPNGAATSQQPQAVQPPPPPKRRRPSAKAIGNGENVEKPPPRKRNRNKGKAKEGHALSSSTNEPAFSQSDSTFSKGIYGIDAKTLDLTRYMKDISLEGLMSGDFNVGNFPRNQDLPPSSIVDNSFGTHVSSILQNLAQPSNADPPPQPRPTLFFAKPVESKPPKFILDLESTPLDENEERLCGALPASRDMPLSYGPDAPFSQSTKPQGASSLFPVKTLPVIPPAEFWNMLQLHPSESLDSLLTQAAASLESRISPPETGVRAQTCDNKTSSLPPLLFSFKSGQALQENACDRFTSSRINHWFRAGAQKLDSSDAGLNHVVRATQGSRFPFKLDFKESPLPKPVEKFGQKEGLFDIDLNKQSPEAVAAESMAHSSSIISCKSEIAIEAPSVVQARIEIDDGCGGGYGSQSECRKEKQVDTATPIKQAEAACPDFDQVMDGQVVNSASQKNPSSPQKSATKGGQNQESLSVYVNKEEWCSEPLKAAPTNASSSLPLLSVPAGHEIQETWSDVPYSPGVQATARLLCKMASSSSQFYVEKDEESRRGTAMCNEAPIQRPAKAARIVGPIEIDVRAHKCPAAHESWDEKQSYKVQARNGKERTLSSQMVSTCTSVGDKANGLIQSLEPWASTPPRNAPKSVASHMSGSQSSESDRSPNCGVREHTSNEVHGKAMAHQQLAAAAASSKILNPHIKKEGKGSHTTVSKPSFLYTTPTKGTSVFLQRKTSTVCEMKQSVHREGLAKLSRPRSNSGKSCLPSGRSASSYPVKPRNTNGCLVKSPRQVLPYVGEIRHGSK